MIEQVEVAVQERRYVEQLADKIKGYDPLAVSYAKQAVTRGLDLSLERGLELEVRLGRLVRASY